MSASVANRLWQWTSFAWAGVVASIVAWAWVWLRMGGASVVMLFLAIAAAVFMYRGTAGMRTALVGLLLAALVMLLASLYLAFQLLVQGSPAVTPADVLTESVFPMVAAVLLALGAAAGLRHARPSQSIGSA